MIYLLQNLQINIFVDHITNHLRIAASVPGEGDTELAYAVECKHDQYEQHPHQRRRHRIHPCPFRGRQILFVFWHWTCEWNSMDWKNHLKKRNCCILSKQQSNMWDNHCRLSSSITHNYHNHNHFDRRYNMDTPFMRFSVGKKTVSQKYGKLASDEHLKTKLDILCEGVLWLILMI